MAITFTQVETSIPDRARPGWVKEVTAVDPRSKTGHDWSGDFVAGTMEMAPGTLIILCKPETKRSNKSVDLAALLPDGQWTYLDSHSGDDWSVGLRKPARDFLALEPEGKILAAIDNAIRKQEIKLAKAADDAKPVIQARIALLQSWKGDAPNARAEAIGKIKYLMAEHAITTADL